MDAGEIANIVDYLAALPRHFAFQELLEFADSDVDQEKLQQAFLQDGRFIVLHQELPDEDGFIPESTLFRWFTRLSLRLAQAHQARLTSRQLAMAMSSLQPDRRWDDPPAQAVQFGQSFGFIAPAWTPGQYVFPLSRILSLLSASQTKVAGTMLESFAEKKTRDATLKRPLEDWVKTGLASFSARALGVVSAREGLVMTGRKTLEQIGDELGVSRERVRQIEAQFWTRMQHPRRRPPFLKALLCDVMNTQGSLVVKASSPDAPIRRFVAKCAYIPQVGLPHTGLIVLGASSEDIASLKSLKWLPSQITTETIASCLDVEGGLCLALDDLKTIAESMAQLELQHMNKAEKVYLALQHIGRPAHYSEVAEAYNSIFPDDPSTEHSVHAVLLREQYGVVWIGVKGTFGLEEWGFERPKTSIFDAVTEIVEAKYKETGKPVPFTVILGEIGKYRQVVNTSSLTFATQLNPNLRRVSTDAFIPKESMEDIPDDLSADEMDRILGQFEETLQPRRP